MLNALSALILGVAMWAILYLPHLLKFGEAVVPGVITLIVAYAILARRSFKRLEAVFTQAAQALHRTPPQFAAAVATLQQGYPIARQQLGIRSQIDTQIGVIYYLQQDFNKAFAYLKRSSWFAHWLGGAMLGVIYYRKKNFVEMRKTMDWVTRRARKNGLAWNLYAYLLMGMGDKTAAQQILTEGVKYAKEDPRVQEALLAIQNGKKFKMRAYKDQWYQFHLEKPVQQPLQTRGSTMRLGRTARRGRWS